MPIDNYTKDFFRSVRNHLETIVGRLDTLVGMADRPRKNNGSTLAPEDAADQKDYAAVRKAFLPQRVSAPHEEEKTSKKWHHTLQGWKTLFEIIAIPFAIVYACVTFAQWRDAARNFRNDERAWIRIDWQTDPSGTAQMPKPTENIPLSVTYSLTNIGKTPAKGVTVNASILILNHSQSVPVEQLSDPAFSSDIKTQFGGLFPGVKDPPDIIIRTNNSGPVPTSSAEIRAINEGTSYIAIFGIARYTDIFGHSHWTKFCQWRAFGNLAYDARSCVAVNGSVDENDL